ncbi:LPXTG cell wall anchor domain-containing protein [Promicromonospora sp. NPDC050249]|uniref:LPXTG cell wall anchor domain-containing protein n=1 Tax=Promicromonospora sp. NPDC050249 TaxID=3154743 RepID=UPI0034089671
MTVLGASALLVAGLMGSPAAAFAAPIAGAPIAATPSGGESTCPKDGKVDVTGEHTTLEVTAEPGYLITGYCVKAGSDKQGNGPVDVVVDPPAATVTISHPSGKAISHYTLVTVKVGSTPTPTPTPSPSVPGATPSPSVPGATPTPTEPGATPTPTPTGPGVEPSDGSVPPVDEAGDTPSPSAAAEEPGELAATGASTAIGFTLIALALVGGGVTLIVLRRKGVLGS